MVIGNAKTMFKTQKRSSALKAKMTKKLKNNNIANKKAKKSLT